MLNKYYTKTNLSPFYALALILNPAYYIRYIKIHWPRKYIRPALLSAKKLWEKYREEVIPLNITPFSYGKQPPYELLELDTFNKIALSLRSVTRPASEDEYEDYNSQESFDPGKKGALA
jgi:hypothetical protein